MKSLPAARQGPRRFPAVLFFLSLPSVVAAHAAAPPVFDPAKSDPRAIAVADLVMAALGGQ